MSFAPAHKEALEDYFTALAAVHRGGTNIGYHHVAGPQMRDLYSRFLQLEAVTTVSFSVTALWTEIENLSSGVKLLAAELIEPPREAGLDPSRIVMALEKLERAHSTVSDLHRAVPYVSNVEVTSEPNGLELLNAYR